MYNGACKATLVIFRVLIVGTLIIHQKLTKVNYFDKGGYLFCMTAQWTAEIVGKMHLNQVTAKQLASEIGWNPKYLSQVLNGHKSPANAEIKVKSALERLLEKKRIKREAT